MHAKAMRLFREYMLVSGMPQSVVAYAENSRDFYASDVERTFTVTISKRPPSDTTPEYPRSLRISPAISRPTRKRSSSLRSTTARYAQYDDPLFWLEDSMICNLCYKCNDPNVGFALSKNDVAVKCYMGDTGLLVSLAFSENELSDQQLYKAIMGGRLSLNEGMIYKNMIAQMIAARGTNCISIPDTARRNTAMT